MVTYVLLAALKQLDHVLLAEPNGLVFQPRIQLHLAIFGLVDQKLSLPGNLGIEGINPGILPLPRLLVLPTD